MVVATVHPHQGPGRDSQLHCDPPLHKLLLQLGNHSRNSAYAAHFLCFFAENRSNRHRTGRRCYMIALVCGKCFPFYPATGNTYAHSPPSESIPSSRPWRCSYCCSLPPNPKPTSSRPKQRRSYRPLRSGEIPVWRDPCIFVFALPLLVLFCPALHRHFDRSCSWSHREQHSGETRFSTHTASQPKSRCLPNLSASL